MSDQLRIEAGLLPAFDAAPRCAVHNREIAVRPAGTGISAGAIAVVDLAKPWPKPVHTHPAFDGLDGVLDTELGSTRVFAGVPDPERPPLVTVWWPTGGGTRVASALVSERPPSGVLTSLLGEIAERPSGAGHLQSEPVLLLCAQGSHDVCCGTEGVRLANELSSRSDLTVRLVSHTGGHRFAPTGVWLPSGVTWAGLDGETVEELVNGEPSASAITEKARGWWGVPTGPAQAADLSAGALLGHGHFDDQSRTVRDMGGGSWAVTSTAGSVRVDVVSGRVVPTITCRAAGGLPAKPGVEWIARDATVVTP